MSVSAYPLQWPSTMPRHRQREKGQFKTALSGALNNVRSSLNLFGRDSGKDVGSVVISSNVTLGVTKPDDPGVSVWFTWDGMQVCIPVDRYQTVEANLQAIHHIIEARRVELRHGTLALVRATFTGFAALPAPATKRHWRLVLGLQGASYPNAPLIVTAEKINEAFRRLSKTRHPDAGGSAEAMAELNVARAEALREIGS